MKVQSQNEVYERLKLLGEGAFGKAYLVKDKSDNSLCVIKQMNIADMSATEQEETFKEAKILQALNHPNIVKFRDVYITTNKKLNIVMEYADGGDLSKRVTEQKKLQKPFPESDILDWFTQLCLAIKHVHDRKIIHRDIKGQNVFITKNNMLKLGDFGIARVLNKTMEKARTVVGTPYYLSPEIIENKPYSFKSDIWSMGVMLYQMCALQPPFNANSLQFLALKIVKGSYQPLQGNFSKQMKSLIGGMLTIDPNRRPSAEDILKLPFIRSRIKNYLTETQNKVEFSHTVLHDFKLNFKVPSSQQINQIQNQQRPQSQQPPQAQQQPNTYESEVRRLKEQQLKLEKQREEARRDDARRQEDAKREEQRKQRVLDQQKRQEDKKRAEDYQKMIDAKRRQLEAAERRKEQQQRRQYDRQMQEERREKEEKRLLQKKQMLQNQGKKREYLQFARAQWMRNQEIRKNAEKRAMMDEADYQPEPTKVDSVNPTQAVQIQKQNISEPTKQSNSKQNYHFKEEQSSKPLVEAYKQLQQPSQQRPSSQNRTRQSQPVLDDQQLMNAYGNPNFKAKGKAQQQPQPQKPIVEAKKQERPSSVQPKKEFKQDAKEQDGLKKKIEEGRQKMREDRMKYQGHSTGDITQGLSSEETQHSMAQQTFKAAKWQKPPVPLPAIPVPDAKKKETPKWGDSPQLEKQIKTGNLNTPPVVEADSEELNKIIEQNQHMEAMIEKELEQEEKQSSDMINMIEELMKIVNDVQEKVEMLPEIKVNLNAARKDDEKQPQRAVDFHENTIYEADDANLEYFSDYNKLQSLRMSLEDVFGTENFVRAYRIIEKDFESVGMAGMDMDQMQKKIDFISEEMFAQHYTLLLTLVVMENKVDEQSRSPSNR